MHDLYSKPGDGFLEAKQKSAFLYIYFRTQWGVHVVSACSLALGASPCIRHSCDGPVCNKDMYAYNAKFSPWELQTVTKSCKADHKIRLMQNLRPVGWMEVNWHHDVSTNAF